MQPNILRQATTVEEINEKFEHFRTEECRAYADAFVPEPTDIFISPFAKSGTTWTQQIVHSLRTRGDMDFREIMDVVPWLEMAYDLDIDLNAPQKAHPRAFKSHRTWDDIPKGARYIYVVRNPKDVIVSDYNFLGGWIFDQAAISLDEFVTENYLKSDYYWRHINSWWSQHDNSDVLFLCFEDMKADLETNLRIIADFMHIDLDDELLDITLKHASFGFMKAHNRQFDDHLIREYRNEAMRLPPHLVTTKVKNGTVGQHKDELSDELIATIDARWGMYIKPEYALENYDTLRDKIKVMNQTRFGY